MDKDQIARLKELAEKADAIIMPNELWAHCNRKVCADFIAAANPQAVLELIAEIERQAKVIDWLAEKACQCSEARNQAGYCRYMDDGCTICIQNRNMPTARDWREAAREAVKEGK